MNIYACYVYTYILYIYIYIYIYIQIFLPGEYAKQKKSRKVN